jgi:hypothetical protein
MHACLYFLIFKNYLFLIVDVRKIPSMTFTWWKILNMTSTRFTLAILLIWFVLGSSTGSTLHKLRACPLVPAFVSLSG